VDIGRRMRTIRRAAELSQEEVARRAGITLKGYGELERGEVKDPHFSTLRGVANALGVPLATLLATEEPELGGKARAPQESGLTEKVAYLLRAQDKLDAAAATRALETGKPQADFAHAENTATALALDTEHSELAGEFVRAVRAVVERDRVIERLRKEREKHAQDPERF
jgi:transcriptional regulator with XRE-family HTH domain